jgi:hypothetical protein
MAAESRPADRRNLADEVITILRDNARVSVRASAAPIRDHAGNIVFAVVTYEDSSDLQALRPGSLIIRRLTLG